MGQIPPPHPFASPATGDPASTPATGHRLALPVLQSRFGDRGVLGAYVFVNGLVSIGIMTAAAMVTGAHLVFPSLGPTAYLAFSDPNHPAAAPRNAVLGHLIGVLAGVGALIVFGLRDAGPAAAMEVTAPRVGAAAVSLAVTGGAMVWLRLPHPPAAATTLIVSLGILTTTVELLVLMGAVVLLVVQGWCIGRLAGLDPPLWSPVRE